MAPTYYTDFGQALLSASPVRLVRSSQPPTRGHGAGDCVTSIKQWPKATFSVVIYYAVLDKLWGPGSQNIPIPKGRLPHKFWA